MYNNFSYIYVYLYLFLYVYKPYIYIYTNLQEIFHESLLKISAHVRTTFNVFLCSKLTFLECLYRK